METHQPPTLDRRVIWVGNENWNDINHQRWDEVILQDKLILLCISLLSECNGKRLTESGCRVLLSLKLHPHHESNSFYLSSFLCLELRTVHTLLQWGSGALHSYTPVWGVHSAPFSGGSCASDARHLNLGFSSSVRSHRRGARGIASLKANRHLSTSKQIPHHAFNRNIHRAPEEPWTQRPRRRCNNSSF